MFFLKQLGGELLNGIDPIGKYQHPREISSPRLNFGTRHRIKVTQLRDLHNFSFVATILEKSVRNKFDKMTEEMNKFYLEVRKIQINKQWYHCREWQNSKIVYVSVHLYFFKEIYHVNMPFYLQNSCRKQKRNIWLTKILLEIF